MTRIVKEVIYKKQVSLKLNWRNIFGSLDIGDYICPNKN